MGEDTESVCVFFEVLAVVWDRHAGDIRDVRISFRVQGVVCISRGESLVYMSRLRLQILVRGHEGYAWNTG